MSPTLPPWRSPIARALHRNRSLPQSRYLQLATIDSQQRPRNRTVVFRGWFEPNSQLKFVTDIRSSKVTELTHSSEPSWAEACWYFPKTREQFRLSGIITLITAESLALAKPLLGRIETSHQQARQEAWQQMSLSGRAQFDWAAPGADRSPDPAAFSPSMPESIDPVTNFGLLLLEPTGVDHLELRGEPQSRYLYRLMADEWNMAQVNP